ncbi:MAG: hypothetical protein ACUVQ8_04180 [Nitrososphaeria archaeon]
MVYREILYNVIEKRNHKFTQVGLSRLCDLSISTVNYALHPLKRMNSIEKLSKGFRVINPRKILLYWASIRNLEEDILYKTYVNGTIDEVESLVPPGTLFTGYTAYKIRFGQVPSEYGEVIVYGEKEDFLERFGKEKEPPNLIVLKLDRHLNKFKQVPVTQIYVDLWNHGSWYSEAFLRKLEAFIDGVLERGYSG